MAIKRPIIALQLYTLREILGDGTAGVLRQVKEMGYEGVELAGYGSLSREEFKAALDENDLAVTSSHAGIEALQNNFEKVVDDANFFGYEFIGVPYLDESRRGSKENWVATARVLNELGKKLRDDAGLTLFYHNHDFELTEAFNDVRGLDLLYENSDAQFVQAELDTYWIQKGGANPTEYLRKYSGRTPLLHIKDMSISGDFAEIGTGVLDWPSIFSAAESGGVTAYIVEQDTTPGNPLDSVKVSIENLKTMGKLG